MLSPFCFLTFINKCSAAWIQVHVYMYANYNFLISRFKVLYCLQNLKFLDSTTVKAADLEEAQRVGPYLTVVRGDGQSENVKKFQIFVDIYTNFFLRQ